ncbi:MAG: DUF1254 domain-containing protein, partial [Anaerolineales bacterium]
MAAKNGSAVSERELTEIAREAYIYTFPLVLMELTRQQMTNMPQPEGPLGPPNRFTHVTEFPDSTDKSVVRPNVDTLYSAAWLDLADGPMVLSISRTERYFMMPMLDMWTEVFAVPGTRTTGSSAQRYLITPHGWTGTVPRGMTQIAAPTRWVWFIGRTQTNGKDDIPRVQKIQQGYQLAPLKAWDKKSYVPPRGRVNPRIDMKTPPMDQATRMVPAAFFKLAADLMKDNPPHFNDQPMVARVARLGMEPGKSFDPARARPVVKRAIARGAKEAARVIAAHAKSANGQVNGWEIET